MVAVSNFLIELEPTRAVGVEHGPMDKVSFNALLLTRENLLKVGASPPTVAQDWDCNCTLYGTVAGVDTAIGMAGSALAGTYWDLVTRVALDLTVTLDADQVTNPGLFTIAFADTDTMVAGMYGFRVDITDATTDIYTICSGKLEILPATPT